MNLRAALIVLAAGLGAAVLLAGCGSSKPAPDEAPLLQAPSFLLPGVAHLPVSKRAVKTSTGPAHKRLLDYYSAVAPWVIKRIDKINGGLQLLPSDSGSTVVQVNTGMASIPVGRQICRITRTGVRVEKIPNVEQIMVNGYDPGSVAGLGPLAQWPQDFNDFILC